ncbi:hypothetical protein JCM9279_007221 [Rhodotorula babjevae]
MACLASLPPELRTAVVEEAAGPTRPSLWTSRHDTLLQLALVGPLHHAAVKQLARAVRVESAAHLAALEAKAATSEHPLDLLYLDNSDGELDADESEPLQTSLVAAFSNLRTLSILNCGDVDLDPLGKLPELESLHLAGCTVTISANVVLRKLARLALHHSTALKTHNSIFLSSSCLPRLRHLRVIPFKAFEGADDIWIYLRPDQHLVQPLASFEHDTPGTFVRPSKAPGALTATLLVVGAMSLGDNLARLGLCGARIRHLRVQCILDPEHPISRGVRVRVELGLLDLARLILENAKVIGDLRTVLLPFELRDLPETQRCIDAAQQAAESGRRAVKVYFSDDSNADAPLGQPTLFMRLADLGLLDD